MENITKWHSSWYSLVAFHQVQSYETNQLAHIFITAAVPRLLYQISRIHFHVLPELTAMTDCPVILCMNTNSLHTMQVQLILVVCSFLNAGIHHL